MKRLSILLCILAAALVLASQPPRAFKADASIYVIDRTVDLGAKEMSVAYLSGATSGGGGAPPGGDCPDATPGFNCGSDEIDAYTVMLFHFDRLGQGGVGANYEDCSGSTYSPHNMGWRQIQNVVMSADSAKFGDSGVSFNGTAYFEMESDYEFFPRSQDFTIDFWTRQLASVDANYRIVFASAVALSDLEVATHAGKFAVYSHDEAAWREATHADARDGSWHHVAVVRSGATLLCFFDGTKYVLDVTWGHDIWDNTTANPWQVGYDLANQKYMGDLDEFRYSIGIARWTENFTPPTTPY